VKVQRWTGKTESPRMPPTQAKGSKLRVCEKNTSPHHSSHNWLHLLNEPGKKWEACIQGKSPLP